MIDEQQFNQLKKSFEELKKEFYRNRFSGSSVAAGFTRLSELTLADGGNFKVGTSVGTKIGTATGEKIAFHGATPVIQRSSAAQNAVAATGATQSSPWGYSTETQANAIITLLNEVRAALVEKGLWKGSV